MRRNRAGGQKTDISDSEPAKTTYADIARKGMHHKPLESERHSRSESPLTFKK